MRSVGRQELKSASRVRRYKNRTSLRCPGQRESVGAGFMTTKTFAYCRVSSDGQTKEDKDGIPRQQRAIEAYAARNDMTIEKWFIEPGVSGDTSVADRLALPEMIAAINANGVRTVLIESPDRMARSIFTGLDLLRTFTNLKVTVIGAIDGRPWTIDMDDPMAKIFWVVSQAIADGEKMRLVARLKSARNRMRAATGRCEGKRPFGESEGEAAPLAIIRASYASRKSMNAIAKDLNERGIPSPRGKKWTRQSVGYVLGRKENAESVNMGLTA